MFYVIRSHGELKILGMWEGSVIYNIFNPARIPNLLPVIQKGADSVGFHGMQYNLLAVTRIIADYFGHSISVLKILPFIYGFITLILLYIIVQKLVQIVL